LQNFNLTVSILRQLCYKKGREKVYNPLTVPNISGGEQRHLSPQEIESQCLMKSIKNDDPPNLAGHQFCKGTGVSGASWHPPHRMPHSENIQAWDSYV
jgi:hypothetical protein